MSNQKHAKDTDHHNIHPQSTTPMTSPENGPTTTRDNADPAVPIATDEHPGTPPAAPQAHANPVSVATAVPQFRSLQPLPQSPGIVLPPDLYYCHPIQAYYLKMPAGNWVQLKRGQVFSHLSLTYGLSQEPEQNGFSEVEQTVYHIEQHRSVDFVGEVAGYAEGYLEQGTVRILVPSGPDLILPSPGDWSMLRGILEKMLGAKQILYFYGWLKVALEMFASQTWMAGQVLILCGPPESGKNLVAFLIQHLFGGRRPGKPYDFMTQKTQFNADLIGAELLTIEDEISHTDIKKRRAFGSRIKALAVNNEHRLHKKYVDGMTVTPLQRLVVSLNDEPERVSILPPVDHDIQDKIIIFKVQRHEMPMPTDTAGAKKAFGEALIAQLPAFVDFLCGWRIPEELKSNRTGVTHYHHPDILDMLNVLSPEAELLRLIDEVLFPNVVALKPWQGRAVELERKLMGADKGIPGEARRLLPSPNCCGRYLGRLAERNDGRVEKHPGHAGIHNWTINPPAGSLLSGVPSSVPNAAQHPMILKIKSTLEAKGSTPETMEAA